MTAPSDAKPCGGELACRTPTCRMASADPCDRGEGGSQAPLLSVVIVSWNDWPKLRRCLESVYADPCPGLTVSVFDNASSDGTPEMVSAFFPKVQLHRNGSNIGHTKAVNRAFGVVRGDYIMVLDSDIELRADCLGQLLGHLQNTAGVDLVAPRTLNTDGTVQETARNFPGPLAGLFGRQSTLARWFPNNPLSRRYLSRQFLDSTAPFEVQQVGAACMVFRRSLVTELGGWDERYPGYWVDTDWCHTLVAAGRRIVCVPSAVMVHHESNARGKHKSPARIWMFHAGAYRLYTRWHTFGPLDPRSILAGAVIAARAGLMIALNARLKPDRAGQAPFVPALGRLGSSRTEPGEPR